MKKLLLLLGVLFILSSCSNDDSPASPQEPFFRLEEGNLWVYKKYVSSDDVNYTYMNVVDSVRVQGDTLIGNHVFKKVLHKRTDSFSTYDLPAEYLRVDNSGHLVNEVGTVLHPGTDTPYQYTRTVRIGDGMGGYVNYGNIYFQLLPNPVQVHVEGANYLVQSYYGNFISNNQAQAPNNHIFYQYQGGLGFVCRHDVAISGHDYYEDRLVYYDLN